MKARISVHLSSSRLPTIKFLKSIGIHPEVLILDDCTIENISFFEDYWIHQCISWGFKLENRKKYTPYAALPKEVKPSKHRGAYKRYTKRSPYWLSPNNRFRRRKPSGINF